MLRQRLREAFEKIRGVIIIAFSHTQLIAPLKRLLKIALHMLFTDQASLA